MGYLQNQLRAQGAIAELGAAPEVAKPEGATLKALIGGTTLHLPNKQPKPDQPKAESAASAKERARAAIAAQRAK